MNLYAGKMLFVNLTDNSISIEPLRKDWLEKYWGCWGLALRYYCELSTPEVDPMSKDNPLVIMTGPLGGTLMPMTSRFCMASKSPATGTIFSTNIGGAFGPELKLAGYDGIVVTGKATDWQYLSILDGRVTLKDARDLAGKGIFNTEKFLKEIEGVTEAKCLSIGTAGENLVQYACIGSECYRQMGRAGGGALWGSKKLKGIVCRGTGSIHVADMAAFMEKVEHYKKSDLLTEHNTWTSDYGTPGNIDYTNEVGAHPTRNFTYGFNEDKDKINGDAVAAATIAHRACTSCPMACGKFTKLNDAEVEGPEYETLCLGGSNCEISDLEKIIQFNRICDDLGMDTISCGNVLGLAMDMTERNVHDFGLRFGQAEEYLKVVEEIGLCSTERGKDLALGAKKLAEKYQAQDLVAEVKGLEFPAYEPRGNYGMGLAYTTSERGACHLRGYTMEAEDPFDLDALVEIAIEDQTVSQLKWSMGLCDFWATLDLKMVADIFSTGLGEAVSAKDLYKSGERIWNLGRLFNLAAGFTFKDDMLPEKILTKPLKKGPNDGRVFKMKDFESIRSKYYKSREWDQQGIPTKKKCVELGLEGFFNS